MQIIEIFLEIGALKIVDTNLFSQKYTFLYLCGFALFLSISIAISNIFLALITISFLYHWKNSSQTLIKEIKSLPKILTFTSIFFIVLVFVSVLFSENLFLSLKVFSDIIVWRMMPLFAVLIFVKSRRQIFILTALLFCSIFLNNLVCVFQGLLNFNLSEWRFGGFLFVMQHASILAAIIPAATLILLSSSKIFWKFIWTIFLLVGVIALIFNGTRGAWLATFATEFLVIFMYFHQQKFKMIFSVSCMILVVIGMFLGSERLNDRLASVVSLENKSNYGRILIWKGAVNMFKDYPLTGIGLGRFGTEYREHYILPEAVKRGYVTHAHNNFLHLLAECGILVLLSYIITWGGYCIFCIENWFKFHDESFLAFFCVVTAILLHGLTEYTFGATVTTKFFWFALGICIQWRKMKMSLLLKKFKFR